MSELPDPATFFVENVSSISGVVFRRELFLTSNLLLYQYFFGYVVMNLIRLMLPQTFVRSTWSLFWTRMCSANDILVYTLLEVLSCVSFSFGKEGGCCESGNPVLH